MTLPGLVITGAAPATPAPLSEMVVGELAAFEVSVIVVLNAVTALGLKTKLMTQLDPTLIEIGLPVFGTPPAAEPNPQ